MVFSWGDLHTSQLTREFIKKRIIEGGQLLDAPPLGNHYLQKYYKENDIRAPQYTSEQAKTYVNQAGFETEEMYNKHIFPTYALQPLRELEEYAHYLIGPTEYNIKVSDAMKRLTPRHLLLPDDTWGKTFHPMLYVNIAPYELKNVRIRSAGGETRRKGGKDDHAKKVQAEKEARLKRREAREQAEAEESEAKRLRAETPPRLEPGPKATSKAAPSAAPARPKVELRPTSKARPAAPRQAQRYIWQGNDQNYGGSWYWDVENQDYVWYDPRNPHRPQYRSVTLPSYLHG